MKLISIPSLVVSNEIVSTLSKMTFLVGKGFLSLKFNIMSSFGSLNFCLFEEWITVNPSSIVSDSSGLSPSKRHALLSRV